MAIGTNELIIAIIIAALLAGTLVYLFWKQRMEIKRNEKRDQDRDRDRDRDGAGAAWGAGAGAASGIPARQLQLQAYERLILLTDRIAIPSLVSRVNQPELSAREMQSLLTQSIRLEFEHNITQQIYVSTEAWDAVRNFKEQNLLIINQISSFLPPEASGLDLNKALLDLLMQNPKASLQNVVSEALSYEAKKLM